MIIGRVNKLTSSPKTSIQVLGPTQPITLFLGVKWSGREAEKSPPSISEVKN
jgi:hypothetical protein